MNIGIKNKITFKFEVFFFNLLVYLVDVYHKLHDYNRGRVLLDIKASKEEEISLAVPNTLKVADTFKQYREEVQEHLKEDELTTDDIAAFFASGVGRDLVKKTNKPVKAYTEQNSYKGISK